MSAESKATTGDGVGPTTSMAGRNVLAMLQVVADAGERSDPLDSTLLANTLGWSDAAVATSLAEARRRLLIWGMRVGGAPAPRFEDIELTVQGRRLLRAGGSVSIAEVVSDGDVVSGPTGRDD